MTEKASKPYPFDRGFEEERILYDFETDQKVRYPVYFSNYEYMFGTHQLNYQLLSIDLIIIGILHPPKGTPLNPRIVDTVRTPEPEKMS